MQVENFKLQICKLLQFHIVTCHVTVLRRGGDGAGCGSGETLIQLRPSVSPSLAVEKVGAGIAASQRRPLHSLSRSNTCRL